LTRQSEAGPAPPAGDGFCPGCGRAAVHCDGGCRRPFDPPRYCPVCGRRLAVLITPTRVEGRCRDHGLVGAGS